MVQFSTRCMAQLRARTPQIMGRYLGKPEFPSVLFHHMPDDPFRYAISPVFACPTDASEQSSGRNPGCSHPQIGGRFDPLGHRHGSNVAAFADQIDYGPMFLALLQMREVQVGQFAAAESAAKQHRKNRTVPFALEGAGIRCPPQAPGFVSREPIPKPDAQLLHAFHTPDASSEFRT